MRVLALMKYDKRAASTRQRLLQFLPYLEQNGIFFEVSPLLQSKYLEDLTNGNRVKIYSVVKSYIDRFRMISKIRTFDAVFIQYETAPYLPSVFEWIFTLFDRPIICDYDDAIFHQYDTHNSKLVRYLLGNKLTPLLRAAAMCICGNAYIESYAAKYCRNTVVIPTVVDTDVYMPGSPHFDRALTIGWIGSPSTWRYLESLLPEILPTIEAAGARLRVVGAGVRAKGITGIDAVDWTEESEVTEVQSFDIGIMPLPDENWARGKCGYKLIQYMACGVPVVASPVGVNVEIVSDGQNGYLASNAEAWRIALTNLINDSAVRQKMGEHGRRRVVEHYSLQSQKSRLLKAISGILNNRNFKS